MLIKPQKKNISQNIQWVPFLSLFRRELTRIYKVLVQTLLAPVFNIFLYLLIFGVNLGRYVDMPFAHSYLAFVLPGLIMMSIINNTFNNASGSIVGLKFSGELEHLSSTAVGPHDMIWALNLASLIRGALVGLLTYLVGMGFIFFQEDKIQGLAHPWILIFFGIIGSFCFSQLGLFSALMSKDFDRLHIISNLILLPLIYLGGVFFSIKNLPSFWQSFAQLNPLLYLINGGRYAFLGYSEVSLIRGVLISLLGFGISYLLAFWAVSRGGTTRRW